MSAPPVNVAKKKSLQLQQPPDPIEVGWVN